MSRELRFATVICAAVLFASLGAAETKNVQITKGPFVEHAGGTTAVIAWSTNEPSSTIVRYGTNRDQLNQTAQLPWGALTHRVTIKNLEPGQAYYFKVESGQAQGSGGNAVSELGTFTTKSLSTAAAPTAQQQNPFQITNGPNIEHVGPTTAIVAWSTDRPASTIVRYGTDPNRLDQTAQQPWGATNHRVEIKNLLPNTQYYFAVHSAQGLNAPGQRAESQTIPFRTSEH